MSYGRYIYDGSSGWQYGAVSILVSTVLQRKVTIISAITQKTVLNTRGKKIIMDVFAVDDHGNVYVIEVENNPTRAKVPRM